MNVVNEMSEGGKHLADALSVGVVIGAFFEWLPELTALVGFIWFLMRMYQTWLEIRCRRKELGE